jgi:glycerol-3-phosphate dehydrogenase
MTYESLESQVARLAAYIVENVPGEPSRSEGAIDCAIRLLRESKVISYQAELDKLRRIVANAEQVAAVIIKRDTEQTRAELDDLRVERNMALENCRRATDLLERASNHAVTNAENLLRATAVLKEIAEIASWAGEGSAVWLGRLATIEEKARVFLEGKK